ncbi:MAG: sulfur carrier protein ThiS [Proteobacteria bacterium]|nr:sulfur carrier protein ThiS [Pseudomonadota bacterium]MCP4919714.1 sulfur carrier protein ThiS [Pseudomonadota bacterium]
MTITVNGDAKTVPDETTLGQLLEQLEIRIEACAVALNLQVVPRRSLATTPLSPGDSVEVVRAVGGG